MAVKRSKESSGLSSSRPLDKRVEPPASPSPKPAAIDPLEDWGEPEPAIAPAPALEPPPPPASEVEGDYPPDSPAVELRHTEDRISGGLARWTAITKMGIIGPISAVAGTV